MPGDIRDEEQCRALVERAVAELGGIDVLVNNAAYQMAQPSGIADITTEQFDRVLKTNLYAMFWLCTKAALPHMQRGRGHHQHLVDPGLPALARAAGLRDDEGRRSSTSRKGLGAGAGRAGHPGQRGRARARSGRR